jgi:hypothetical protein
MRKWSKQGFLNPADSNDDGWYKFSIRPKVSGRNSLGLSIQYIISDCSNKIYLEFEPDYISTNSDGTPYSIEDAKRALKSVEVRRKKIRDFAAAVALSAEKIEGALDEFADVVQASIDKALDKGE